MKIIDSYWFTGFGMLGCVGVIFVESAGKRKVYVGSALGQNQEQDERFIVENGGKLELEFAEKIAKFLNESYSQKDKKS